MQLRTFVAKDMREALAQVRSAMGEEAVIVGSQRSKGGGVTVRAALDAAHANTNDARALNPDTPQSPDEKIEFAGTFEQIFGEGMIQRLRSMPSVSALPVKNFNRSELLRILRGHRTPESLTHPLAETAEKSGLSDMTLALASALDRRMRIAPLFLAQAKALLLVGPCGAGKTAVAAKIAAHARLAGRDAKLVATDMAGAGAVARLETFAQHLGVPAAKAETAEAIAASVTLAAKENVLTIIDTAGFDPRDAKARTAFAALSRLPDIETLGVISATGDAEEIAEITGALVTLGIQRLVVTGLDATRRFGALLAAATQGAALAHTTRSPFVSGGLETLTPLSLARLLIEAGSGDADSGSSQ
jgi:flagellar biosynthesis protein FlhF